MATPWWCGVPIENVDRRASLDDVVVWMGPGLHLVQYPVRAGKLYMALPPLYRLSHGKDVAYAADDAERDRLLATTFKGKKPEIGRFKGLGEMMPAQLKETTMDPDKRTLARVTLPRSEESVESLVETLMGRKPELRFRFIQENAEFAVEDLDL